MRALVSSIPSRVERGGTALWFNVLCKRILEEKVAKTGIV